MVKKTVMCLLSIILTAGIALASATQEMERAAIEKKVAFVLVFEPKASQLDQARQIIAESLKQIPGSVKIELDRTSPENSGLVSMYRLSTAPIPLILVASSTGIITGGIPVERATPEILVKMVPSPKKSEIIKAISERNATIITVSRKNMKSLQALNTACADASKKMGGKLIHIMIDRDDKAEHAFLNDLQIDMNSPEPVILVTNAMGQISGRFTGNVQSDDLIAAALKNVGGCCPSTPSNPKPTCGPVKQ